MKPLDGPEDITIIRPIIIMSLLAGGGLLSLCSKCTRSLSRLTRPAPPRLQVTRHYQWKKQTHYDVLGIHPEATQAEIKAAYLKLSKVCIHNS